MRLSPPSAERTVYREIAVPVRDYVISDLDSVMGEYLAVRRPPPPPAGWSWLWLLLLLLLMEEEKER